MTAAGAGAVPSSDRYNGAVSAALVGGVAHSPLAAKAGRTCQPRPLCGIVPAVAIRGSYL